MKKVDENKICFIACVNDERLYEESVLYLKQLTVPTGMEVELIAVRGAESMTAGYQEAMEASNAKYKIYMHQDVFILNRNILLTLLGIFRQNKHVGMVGVVGAGELPREMPIWWKSAVRYGKLYHRKSMEEIQMDVFGEFDGDFASVQAMDGLFMATQYDIPWRTDLFKGWHFYDISQCQEFVQYGYQPVIVRQQEPWLVHAAGRRLVDDIYLAEMEKFKRYYCVDKGKGD